MRAEGWWSALDHIFAWSLTHIHQCNQQSLKILKGFQQYANDLFLHQFPGCFSLLNMQHIIMFYINSPFKSYHVILRQPKILAAFCVKELMCKWGGVAHHKTASMGFKTLQVVALGFSVTSVAANNEGRGGGELNSIVLSSWGNANPFLSGLYSSEGKTDSVPKRQFFIIHNVCWWARVGLHLPFNVIRIVALKGISQQSPSTLWWASWRSLSRHRLGPFLLNKTERQGAGGSGTCPGH